MRAQLSAGVPVELAIVLLAALFALLCLHIALAYLESAGAGAAGALNTAQAAVDASVVARGNVSVVR